MFPWHSALSRSGIMGGSCNLYLCTFYKAVIPLEYWNELWKEHSVVIQRWPAVNGLKNGFDLTEPEGTYKNFYLNISIISPWLL
jgi:hypothetical protein